jgi:hypothetical protein
MALASLKGRGPQERRFDGVLSDGPEEADVAIALSRKVHVSGTTMKT